MLTILSTNGALTCPKYDIGHKRVAASTISTISGWVNAAKDMIAAEQKEIKYIKTQVAKRQEEYMVKEEV